MRKNCFAYDKDNKCKVLKVMVCQRGNCRFFKTEKQYRDDRSKAEARLASLTGIAKRHVFDNYEKIKLCKGGV